MISSATRYVQRESEDRAIDQAIDAIRDAAATEERARIHDAVVPEMTRAVIAALSIDDKAGPVIAEAIRKEIRSCDRMRL